MCEFDTRYKCDLKKHQQSKHDGVRYLCNNCEFQTAQQNYLRVHQRKKHGSMIEIKIEIKQEPEPDLKKQNVKNVSKESCESV